MDRTKLYQVIGEVLLQPLGAGILQAYVHVEICLSDYSRLLLAIDQQQLPSGVTKGWS